MNEQDLDDILAEFKESIIQAVTDEETSEELNYEEEAILLAYRVSKLEKKVESLEKKLEKLKMYPYYPCYPDFAPLTSSSIRYTSSGPKL